MIASCPVYLFRSALLIPRSNTVISVAPVDRVVAVYGGGGAVGEDGLATVFGGAVIYRNDVSGECFIGVWGNRKASRFRRELRAQMEVVILKMAPDARLSAIQQRWQV